MGKVPAKRGYEPITEDRCSLAFLGGVKPMWIPSFNRQLLLVPSSVQAACDTHHAPNEPFTPNEPFKLPTYPFMDNCISPLLQNTGFSSLAHGPSTSRVTDGLLWRGKLTAAKDKMQWIKATDIGQNANCSDQGMGTTSCLQCRHESVPLPWSLQFAFCLMPLAFLS